LPAELANKPDGLAGRPNRPRGGLVKVATEAYVGLAEERRLETLEALHEVSAGQFVEHGEVETWSSAFYRDGSTRPRERGPTSLTNSAKTRSLSG
jgi:predicted transcriptional regulator